MNRRHNAKFWLLMTALGFVGGSCLFGFQYSNLNAERAHVNELQSQTQDESKVQAELTKSQQDLEDAQAKLTHLEKGIPSTAYVPTMLQELAKVGKDSGIDITGVRPVPKTVTNNNKAQAGGGSVQKAAYDELDIQVKGTGDYGSVLKFVKALQTFPKIVGSHSIDIAPCLEPKDAEAGKVDITIGLRAYLFKDSGKDDSGPTDDTTTASDASTSKGASA